MFHLKWGDLPRLHRPPLLAGCWRLEVITITAINVHLLSCSPLHASLNRVLLA